MSNNIDPNFIMEFNPTIRVRSISFNNFKVFDNFGLDFKNNNFICLFGSNGCGKTTVLDSIQMCFSRFEGFDKERLKHFLGKSVRHTEKKQTGIYNDEDFKIVAEIESSLGNYNIEINKNGFIKDHPSNIKEILYRLCFYARFDQELHQFQLNRNKWENFKELFEAVTGFEVEEIQDVFTDSGDPKQAKLLKEYVLGFYVKKPNEIIHHKECSAGEKKIIKCFSTLLNKDIVPKIILIDNIEMHVETGRHINLIKSIKKCFKDSQIFSTTHSYQLSKNFGIREELYDLRIIKVNDIIKKEPYRLYLIDELRECKNKINSMIIINSEKKDEISGDIDDLIDGLNLGRNNIIEVENIMKKITELYIEDIVKYYSNNTYKD